jgi:hypothetical protein
LTNDNPGLVALDVIRSMLSIDDEWTDPVDQGYEWWAYRLRQKFVAETLRKRTGGMSSAVRISTDIVSGVSQDAAQLVAIANMQQTLSALVWDPDRGTISECCTALVHDENIGWIGRLLGTAAILQNTAAHSRAHALADAVGGVPAASQHPIRGERPEMDEVLNVPLSMAKNGKKRSGFSGALTKALGPFVEQFGLAGQTRKDGFSLEIQCTGDPSAASQDSRMPTASVDIETDAEHPQLGHGALVVLRLNTNCRADAVFSVANALNMLESKDESGTSLLGAWCPDPEGNDVAFNAFLPSDLAEPGILENMILYQIVRAQWATQITNQ